MNKDIYLVGASSYGAAIHELATSCGFNPVCYYDDDEKKINTKPLGTIVKGKFSELKKTDIEGRNFAVGIGHNKIRYEFMEKIIKNGGITPNLIHPRAIISPSAVIGKGVYIHAGAYIWTEVKIDDFTIISPNVVISHHSNIGKACLISFLSGIGAMISIEDLVLVGSGSTLITGVTSIGRNSIIGAGSVVLKNIEHNSVYAGVPARKIREITQC
jgi:sugar O-acyltransferase (sialic acid O-acetyltransferase NeuD family)